MNKRRRFGAKRRRREAKLKQMWMSGMSPAELFRRIAGPMRPSILDRFRPRVPQGWPSLVGRGSNSRLDLRLPAHDVHQERADHEGVPRSLAKARNYAELYSRPIGHGG